VQSNLKYGKDSVTNYIVQISRYFAEVLSVKKASPIFNGWPYNVPQGHENKIFFIGRESRG
jgi:hypothetical protein